MISERTDLPVAPADFKMQPSARVQRKGTRRGNVVAVSKTDFEYMAQQKFCGWFALKNAVRNKELLSERLALMLKDGAKPTVRLKIVNAKQDSQSPDGATWRTVRLVSAYRDASGRRVAVNIDTEVGKAKGGAK